MSTLSRSYDDTREEATSAPLSEEDSLKLDKVELQPFIESMMKQTELTEEKIVTALEGFHGLDEFEFPKAPELDDDIFPAVGLEDFKDRALMAFDKIIEWLKAIARWLYETLDMLAVSVAYIEQQIRQTKLDLRMSRLNNTGSFTFADNIPAISLRYSPAADIGKLSGAVSSLTSHLSTFYAYVDKLVGQGKLTSVLAQVSVSSARGSGLVDTMIDASPLYLEKTMNMKAAPDIPGAVSSSPLLGNIRLVLRKPSSISSMSDVNRISFKLEHIYVARRKVPTEVKFPHFNRQQMDAALDRLLETVVVLREAISGKPRKQHRQMVNDIESLKNRLRNDLREFDDSSINQRILACKTLGNWISQPYRSLAVSATRTLRGVHKLCRRNMSP